MALIPYVKIEDCCQELQDRFKARRPLNVSLMIAHSEPVALAGQELGDALMRQAKLSPKLREMAILLNARNCAAYYEWVAHIPAAKAYGATPPPGSGIPANADLVFDIELVSIN